jgi:hypothetical protein
MAFDLSHAMRSTKPRDFGRLAASRPSFSAMMATERNNVSFS